MHSAQHYRDRAAQARRLSESVSDDRLRLQLKTIAADYEQLADEVEKLPAPPLAN